jgi:hypothetical protein
MRGVALLFMLVHHLLSWTMGGVRARPALGWIDDMAVTDLAAPMFAMGAGAAAVLVGRRRPVGDLTLVALQRASDAGPIPLL